MKVLIDEQLSPQIAAMLRDHGFDAEAVARRADLVGSSDRTIFEAAAAEARAVVTNNIKDFRPLAAEWLMTGRRHAGLILVPSTRTRTRSATSPLVAALEAILRRFPDGIADSEQWVGPLP